MFFEKGGVLLPGTYSANTREALTHLQPASTVVVTSITVLITLVISALNHQCCPWQVLRVTDVTLTVGPGLESQGSGLTQEEGIIMCLFLKALHPSLQLWRLPQP